MSSELVVQILKLLAGIGMFVFGMYLVEEAAKHLSGRGFKKFLQRITKTDVGAVAGGAVITTVLQSSSIVSMMVLAFVGAGVFTLHNAMGVLLGANLGSTAYNWIVATLGFKIDIEVVAYPAMAIGGLALMIGKNQRTVRYASFALLGFGLLFIGLGFMKAAMEDSSFDLRRYAGWPLIAFVLVGFVVTLIVQSSSVTIALTLSALYAGSLSFPVAAAIALGSEAGTSVKTLLGAIGNDAVKKRVALGNFLFNIISTILVFLLIRPMLALVVDVLGIKDPLIGLVSFQTLTNLVTILLFLPFLGPFTRLLDKFFRNEDNDDTAYLSHANTREPETAIDLFRKETAYFIYVSMRFNRQLFGLEPSASHQGYEEIIERKKLRSLSQEEQYEYLKRTQGEIQAFFIRFAANGEDGKMAELNQLNAASRSSMHAVKNIKDISNNINDLSRSSHNIKYDFFLRQKKELQSIYDNLTIIMSQPEVVKGSDFQPILNSIHQNYTSALEDFYKDEASAHLQDTDISTMLNFNRSLFTSNKAMLMAVKDYVLEGGEAQQINETMVYTS